MQTEENVSIVVAFALASACVAKRDVVQEVKYMHRKELLSGAGIVSKEDVELAISLGCKGVVISGR